MRVALTWWGWAGVVAAVVVILGIWARRAWRTAVRAELVDYLRREVPDIAIAEVHANRLLYTGQILYCFLPFQSAFSMPGKPGEKQEETHKRHPPAAPPRSTTPPTAKK